VRAFRRTLRLSLLFVSFAAAAGWNPETLRGEDTVDFLTVGREEGEHWSRVWP
jgi:hypothetical protein